MNLQDCRLRPGLLLLVLLLGGPVPSAHAQAQAAAPFSGAPRASWIAISRPMKGSPSRSTASSSVMKAWPATSGIASITGRLSRSRCPTRS